MDDQEQLLSLAERAGVENLKERLANGDRLASSAGQLLALLMAGIGGALALGRTVLDAGPASPSVWAAGAVAIYWAVVAVALVRGCVMTRSTPVVFNEPLNLYRPETGWSLRMVRESDLQLLQERINQAKERNIDVAQWLDRCTLAALLGPLVFVLVSVAVAAYR
jgi:hypothetical protein